MSLFVSSSKKQKVVNKNILLEIVEEPIIQKENLYSIVRYPYISSEYIPTNIIKIIMEHHFPSCELVLSYTDNHNIYKIMVKDLLVERVKNWEYNRPPDMARCPDIARYIIQKNT